MNQNSKFSVRDICYAGLFAAVIAVMAQISIPMPLGVPMTMQTFAITLAAVVLGSKLSAIATLVYLLLGAVGVPVLANFSGGIDKFVGPTGGFLTSFPIMAYIIGLGVEGVSLDDVECTSKTLPGFAGLWAAMLATAAGTHSAKPEPEPGVPGDRA